MNEHEIDRISAAMHQLRPDWPVKSLRTILNHPQLRDRPRRDVVVALSWVACEPATHTPARVFEAGPWWKAAGIEGNVSNRDNPEPGDRCSICSLSKARCRQVWSDDHEFQVPTDEKRGPEQMAQIVQSLRAEVVQTAPKPEPRPVKRNPRVEAIRAQLHADTEEAS